MDTELPAVDAALSFLSSSSADRGPAATGASVAAGPAVARYLAEWGANEALQAAGALHKLAHAPGYGKRHTADQVAAICGERTAQLLTAYHLFHRDSPFLHQTKIHDSAKTIQPRQHPQSPVDGRRGNPLVLQLSHAYCGAYQDPELAFLYAAVLWQHFQIAFTAGKNAQRVDTDEARLLLAPFLEMLGMRELRTTVDGWLALQLDPARPDQNLDHHFVFDQVTARLRPQLDWAQFNLSTYTQTHNLHFSSVTQLPINPLPAMTTDVLVPDDEACYRALYQIQQTFTPIEGGLLDNIKIERVNGFRALSATVWATVVSTAPLSTAPVQHPESPPATHDRSQMSVAHRKVRVQFRMVTAEMDEVNRWGLAAFLMRRKKEGELPSGWWRERESGRARIAAGEPGSFPEMLYVFSPMGQLFEFRRGCTVVDYAYHVHSVLADHCLRFHVNGRVVEPTTVLHHLDLVQLEHDAHAPGPTQVWLNAARTGRARSKIESFLKRRGLGVYRGQKILNREMEKLETYYGFNIPEHRTRQAIRNARRRLNLTSRDEVFTEIATGRLDARSFLHRLFDAEIVRQIKLPDGLRLRPHQMRIAGCCQPRLGDALIGRARRRGGNIIALKVHRQGCEYSTDSAQRPEDRIELKWRLQPTLNEIAQIEMTALDGDGLLGDAIEQIYAVMPRVTLHSSVATTRNGIAHITFTIEAEGQELLDRIVIGLRFLPDRSVDRVRLVNLPPSEQEEILTTGAPKASNPYSRLPVRQRELFFGRKRELEQIAGWLRMDDGNIWLRGQKRVGKTSLLFYLKRHYLDPPEFILVFVDFQLLSVMDGPGIFYSVANAIYTELQASDNPSASRIDEVGPPLSELFALQPSQQLMEYLLTIQSKLGQRRIVLLLDEFSRTIDAWEQGRLDSEFFVQWRGMMLNTPGINCVTVVQQRTYDRLLADAHSSMQEPIWELLELGEQLTLRPLDEQDVRRLIEWPMQNFLDYSPKTVEHVATMTGGSPFLIQAFCSRLTAHMNRARRRQVTPEDVETICHGFMQPNESLFAHLLDMLRGIGNTVAQKLADLAETAPDHAVPEADLCAAMPTIDPALLQRTLYELQERDIVEKIEPDRWRFCNRMFQLWLAANPIGEGLV